MQTIIMTVGTSLRTNRDEGLDQEDKRPWCGKKFSEEQKALGNLEQAINWMDKTSLELISAETNTLWRLDPCSDDEIILLHSETVSGLECAEVIQHFAKTKLGQDNVRLEPIPGINYKLDESGSALERMAKLLKELIEQASSSNKIITLAATGGFKAQTMVMAIVGNSCSVPVCYVHEQYKALIYLPYLSLALELTKSEDQISLAKLPESSKPRTEVINVQESKEHHRPKVWNKVKKMLKELSWVEYVRFDKNAFNAPKNGVKLATRGTKGGCHIFWIHLYESKDTTIAVSVETTGYTREHSEQAAAELRQKLSDLIS